MQYICLFGIVSLIYGNEDSLLDNFNNNIESFSKIDTKTLSYMPSIQLAVNNKSCLLYTSEYNREADG